MKADETKRDRASGIVERLFCDWGPALLRYAYRTIGSRQAAEDVVQEVFAGLYKKLVKGARIRNAKAWTLNAVRFQCNKYFRSRYRANEVFWT